MEEIPVLKRPKSGDTEEELIRMQEDFLASKDDPSAKVINVRHLRHQFKSSDGQPGDGKSRSRFAEMKKLRTRERVSTSQTAGEVLSPVVKEKIVVSEKPQDPIHNLSLASSRIVLGNVVEKKFDACRYKFKANAKTSVDSSEAGFPEVFVSDSTRSDDRHSLFWAQVTRKQCTDSNEGNNTRDPEPMEVTPECEGTNVVNEELATEIHKENMEKLSQMTREEILEEKRELETILKPELLQFLKNRGNKKQTIEKPQQSIASAEDQTITTDEETNEEIQSSPMDVDDVNRSIPAPPKEILHQAKAKGWVHMDSIEPEKLKWMEDLPASKTVGQPADEEYNARFNFSGLLLPYRDENVPLEKGLHHHGEEPDRPGYSLQELLQLSRSSTQQQRCTALTTLGNIMEKSRRGWYDKALHPAPLTALSQRNLLLLLRFSLDDTSTAVVTASLRALRSFLCSEADELCLDRLYGFNDYGEPALTPPKYDVKDTSKLKDHELAQLDAIAALLRSDIVLRIRYVLNELRPPPIAVNCALEILTRLARHSHVTALNIGSTPHLLETIVEHFVPLSTSQLATGDTINDAYGVPLTAAIRFFRVLVSYGGKAMAQRLERLRVVQSLISYVSCDAGKYGMDLSIESLRLWKALLRNEVATDSVIGAQLILLSQLQLLLSNHDVRNASELACEHAAALIAVASCHETLKENISVLLDKWNAQLPTLESPNWGPTKVVAETLLAVDDTSANAKLVVSRSRVFSRLTSTSNLLSDCTLANEREPSSLPHLGVLAQDGELQPAVSQQSCMPFLATALSAFVENSRVNELREILRHKDLRKYLKRLETSAWCLESSWYTRFELRFLTSVVKGAHEIRDQLDNEILTVLWKIAIKLTSTLPSDLSSSVRDMLQICLSREKINLEIIVSELSKLNLGTTTDYVAQSLNREVASLYEKYLTRSNDWQQAAMPKDWLYLPLVHVFAKSKNGERTNAEDEANVLTLLALELILPDLLDSLSQSLRFSRLVLVYLCETLHLNKDISALTSRVFATLLRNHHGKLNFAIGLPGLSSFADLFTLMCEDFCFASYGDHGFSRVLLVPIAQRHDSHYRKLLWSEHVGVLRYVTVPVQDMIVPLREYLYPVEEDSSLIESYMTSIVREVVRPEWCPVPYAIAVHHCAMYLRNSSKLAIRMRERIESFPNGDLRRTLLSYVPPEM